MFGDSTTKMEFILVFCALFTYKVAGEVRRGQKLNSAKRTDNTECTKVMLLMCVKVATESTDSNFILPEFPRELPKSCLFATAVSRQGSQATLLVFFRVFYYFF